MHILRERGAELVAHDREQPGAQVAAGLPQMGADQRPQQGVLHQIVGVGVVAMPAPHGAAQKRNFVEPFVYYISQRTDLVGVREWLTVNRERVLAFLDLVSDRKLTQLRESGLEGLLKKYGVQATNEFVVRVPSQRDLNLFGPTRVE